MRSITILIIALFSVNANANLVWDWDFAGESGQFITDGTLAVDGRYNILDFVVLSSAAGATLGSWSDEQYSDVWQFNGSPYYFDWKGEEGGVYEIFSAQLNWDNLFSFNDVSTDFVYLFGWETGNIENVAHAVAYDEGIGGVQQTSSVYTVTPGAVSAIPIPAAAWLFASALGGLGWFRRKQTA
jgi:hypothetical protein